MCVIGRKRGINKSVKFYSEIWPFGERPRKRGGGGVAKTDFIAREFYERNIWMDFREKRLWTDGANIKNYRLSFKRANLLKKFSKFNLK